MNYKYKEEIRDDIFEPAFQYPHEEYAHEEKLKELDEVYRKSQAFDRIENYLADQQAYDWDDEYTLTLIAEEVEKVVMEEE